MDIVLLASYPKSGNTWVRCIIEALRTPDLTEIDLNRLQTGSAQAADVDFIDCFSGIDVNGVSIAQSFEARRMAYETATGTANGQTLYLKCHDANIATGNGRLFHKGNIAKCIYIVRSPLDIAPSYAHHNSCDLDDVIAHMANPDAFMEDHLPATVHRGNRTAGLAPQPLMRWCDHTESFLDRFDGPMLLCRYEDLHLAPQREVSRIAAFLEIAQSSETIDTACRLTAFQALADREQKDGFAEAPTGMRRFFRSGRTGDGHATLSDAQKQTLYRDHGAMMARLGYARP